MPAEVSASFDCQATAAVLHTSGSLALAAHVATAVNLLSTGSATWLKCGAALVWCAIVYLTIRVKLDARLFELLAAHPPDELDNWLQAARLRTNTQPRTIPERRNGALKLWRTLVIAVVIAIALMLLAVFRLLP